MNEISNTKNIQVKVSKVNMLSNMPPKRSSKNLYKGGKK